MKRTIMVTLAAILAFSASAAFAQGSAAAAGSGAGAGIDTSGSIRNESDMYPVRVDVTRVYVHAHGYKVVYRKGQAAFAEAFIPMGWFVPGGKAMLVQSRGPQYPYMVVFYKADGSFSHVKLYVLRNMRDSTWGTIEGDPGDKFKVETLKLEF